MRSGTRLAVFSLLALCAALAVGGSGAAANNNPGASGKGLVVTYSTPGQLSDVTRTTIRGFPTGTGGCRFAFPKLKRQNGASASGSWNTWWLSGTGWSSHSVSSFINAPQCANRNVSTTTSFSNGLF